nr:MAG TPA: hypothetical protein [Caudoviricetes sp.]
MYRVQRVPAIVSVFFYFLRLKFIKRYEKIKFVSLGATSFLAIDTSKVFGFVFCNAMISIRKRVFHILFS